MKKLSLVLFLLLPFAMLVAVGDAAAQEYSFLGNKDCKKCHIKEYKSWEATLMAKTFDVLKPGERAEAKTAAGVDPNEDFTTNGECLSCHSTGWGKPGGFTSIEETPHLAGVGCEACHGAGSGYSVDELMSLKNKTYKLADVVAAGMVEKVSEAQCIVCHNADNPLLTEEQKAAFSWNFEEEIAKADAHHEKFPLKYEH